jgi:DNA-binding NarL/FixJ family response regulator
MKKILVVEDESIVARDIRQKLTGAGYEVTGLARDYDRALRLFNADIPDLIICDIYLKSKKTGIDFVERTRRIQPVPVVYLTAYSDDESVSNALNTQPSSYLVKPFTKKQLLATVERIINQELNGVDKKLSRIPKPTPRELQILSLIAEGNTSVKVAELLELSPETVQTHRKNMLKKYSVNSTVELVALAAREMWLNQ